MHKKLRTAIQVAFDRQLNLLADVEGTVNESFAKDTKNTIRIYPTGDSLQITVKCVQEKIYADGSLFPPETGAKPVGSRTVVQTHATMRVRSSVDVVVD